MRIFFGFLLLFLLAATPACSTVGHGVTGIENFDQVSPTLYRGAQPTAEGFRTLAAYHVKTILNLRDGDDTEESRLVREAGMTYIRLPLDAETVTEADAERILSMLSAAEGPVFVHCLVGRDRTGLAVAAYRMRVQGWTTQAALRDLNEHGHFWALYPKVREAIMAIGNSSTAGRPMAAGLPETGALTDHRKSEAPRDF